MKKPQMKGKHVSSEAQNLRSASGAAVDRKSLANSIKALEAALALAQASRRTRAVRGRFMGGGNP